jgi:hypothetical protein
MNFQAHIKETLGTTKIPVMVKSKEIGYLQLLTKSDLENPNLDVAKKFTQWRTKYKEVFFSVFDANEERTKNWLLNHVIGNPNKAFFKLLDSNSKMVGHAGAIYYPEGDYIEYDNLIIGEEVSLPGFVYFVEMTFLKWLQENFNVKYILSRVLSTNDRVVTLHQKTGFKLHDKIPFKMLTVSPSEYKWIVDEGNNNPEAWCIDLRLYKNPA